MPDLFKKNLPQNYFYNFAAFVEYHFKTICIENFNAKSQ